eukprot:scaffold6485_cov116-Skeletonema_dohrnii-CCMP3373.AAC.12
MGSNNTTADPAYSVLLGEGVAMLIFSTYSVGNQQLESSPNYGVSPAGKGRRETKTMTKPARLHAGQSIGRLLLRCRD